MNDETLCSLRNVLDYLQDNEQKHYDECSSKERKNHIFNDIIKVRKWLDE